MRSCLTLLAMLAGLSAGDPKMILVKVKFIESTAKLEGVKAGVLVTPLTERETTTLLEKLGADSKVLHSPNMTLNNDQPGNIFLGDITGPLITRYDIHIDEAGKSTVVPVADTLRFGTTLKLQAAAGEKVAFEMFELSMSMPRRKPAEMKKVQTPHGEITDPEFQTVKYMVRASIKDGDTLLVGPLDKPWGAKDDPKMWVLVTAKVVEEPAK